MYDFNFFFSNMCVRFTVVIVIGVGVKLNFFLNFMWI